ncbi:MAG: oligopeptide transporter, OPT family [bacterium]|nr:oligopeptide transporter, OPT family [bacterium]
MQTTKKADAAPAKHTPFVPASESPAEVTWRAIILGVILALVFGLANAYLGLKVGMTVSASIPAAVVSMAILRMFRKRATVLENNIVQGMGSAGESLAAGVIFTVPAFFIWSASAQLKAQGYTFQIAQWQIILLALLGGTLGVLLMIPLRRYLVETEHGKLAYPEGTACAEIIVAGDQGGSRAKLVFTGIAIGAAYKILMSGVKTWSETVNQYFGGILKGGQLGIEATPALAAVGYIIGPRIAAMMLSGAVLGYMGIGPLLSFIGSHSSTLIVPPGTIPLGEMSAGELRNFYIKYIGVGAVTMGGFISLSKSMPIIVTSFREGFRSLVGKKVDASIDRTNYDLPMKWVLLGILAVTAGIALIPGTGLPAVGIIAAVIFGFFFVVVAARIVGLVGSSSNPVSGMTIATLLITSLLLVWLGHTGITGMVAAMMVGTIVCIAVCMSGDISQDLKTGFLLGGTPIRMQLTTLIGMAAPALVIGAMLFFLRETFGFVEGEVVGRAPMMAPQANVMATVVSGIMNQNLPWLPIIVGGMIAICVELLGHGALPFAIGLYLPPSLSTPIMLGGIVAWIVNKRSKPEDVEGKTMRGTLFASGLVAGDSLIGVLLAFLVGGWSWYGDYFNTHGDQGTSLTTSFGPILSIVLYVGLAVLLYRMAMGGTKSKT